MSSIDTSNINVDTNGRVSFSGATSGIDFQAIIDATINSRRQGAISMEATIASNREKITAYGDLKTLSESFVDVLDDMRGSTSFFADNVFKSKTGSILSAAGAGAAPGYEPSAATDLISVAIAEDAVNASHTISIQTIAKAHQLRSDAITDTATDLTTLGITAGSFTIGSETITINTGDTLVDLEEKINAAGAGVNATIVSASATANYLVITSEDGGTANAISFGVGTTTSDDLGLTNGGAIKTELVAAADASLTVDGISGITRSTNEIDDIIDGVTLSLLQAETDTDITINIETDLNTVKTKILEFVDGYNAIRAYYDDQRSQIDRDSTVDFDNDGDLTNDEEYGVLAFDSTLRAIVDKMSTLAVTSNNTLTDGFQGLAQIGITVNADFQLEIEEDTLDNKLLTAVDDVAKVFEFDFNTSDSRVKYVSNSSSTVEGTYFLNIASTDINGDVTAANLIPGVEFTQELLYSEELDNAAWTASGVSIIADSIASPDGSTTADTITKTAASFKRVEQSLSGLTDGSNYTFSTYVKDLDAGTATVRLDLGANNYAVDVDLTLGTVSASAGSDTAEAFGIEDAGNGWYRVYVTGALSGSTTGFARIYPDEQSATTANSIYAWGSNFGETEAMGEYVETAAATATGFAPTSNGFGGADDSSVTISGTALTATSGTDADGLKILFEGANSLSAVNNIKITFTRGIADSLFSYFDNLTELSGTFDDLTNQLTERNDDLEEDILVIDARLETVRTRLELKYIAMETALAQLESLRSTISSFTDAQNNSS